MNYAEFFLQSQSHKIHTIISFIYHSGRTKSETEKRLSGYQRREEASCDYKVVESSQNPHTGVHVKLVESEQSW